MLTDLKYGVNSYMESEELVMTTDYVHHKRRYFYFGCKRVFDILCSIIGLVALVPIIIGVKIAYISTGDFDSIFYRQTRLGKHGKKIRIFKLRTMVPNADEILKNWLNHNPEKRAEYLRDRKIENDPRITKIGNFLRKSSLDEFPQFINIFAGDMSLIGPRPVVPDEVKKYKKNKDKFLSVRPGLTGYWASNGRSNISYDERIKMELYYVDHCGFLLDLQIIFDTIFAVIKKDGAK